MLGSPIVNGGFIAGTIVKPKLGPRPEPFEAAAYRFWSKSSAPLDFIRTAKTNLIEKNQPHSAVPDLKDRVCERTSGDLRGIKGLPSPGTTSPRRAWRARGRRFRRAWALRCAMPASC